MKKILISLACAITLSGCQTSPIVKDLSKAHAAALESAQKEYKRYADGVTRFVEAAGFAAKAEATRDYETRKDLLLKAHRASPEELANAIETAKGDFDREISTLNERVALIKSKSEELAKVWPALIASQQEIYRYLTTKRIDQQIGAEISTILKIDAAKVEASATSFLDKLSTLSPKP